MVWIEMALPESIEDYFMEIDNNEDEDANDVLWMDVILIKTNDLKVDDGKTNFWCCKLNYYIICLIFTLQLVSICNAENIITIKMVPKPKSNYWITSTTARSIILLSK